MSKNSGRTTRRSLAVSNYKGYDIIKVSVKEHEYSRALERYTDWGRTKVHYDFCEAGNANKPSTYYEVWKDSVEDCKACVDKHISGEEIYFTSGERQKYVYAPNHKNGWGFNYESIMRLMKQHQKADKRIQTLLEDRLEDANFHTYCGLLCEKKYKEFEELAASELTKGEKFEVYTHTKRKAIKDPKSLEDGLKKVLEGYLIAHGIKDTSVEVKYCAEW